MAQNPYSMVFGRSPSQLISRRTQADQITETFNADDPAQRVFMITGVRGSGKTVFMTETVRHFAKESRWITVELNPDRDLLTGLAARLSSENYLAKLFQTARINLSFFGFGLEVGGTVPITDIETALEKMFESIKKEGRRVLIAIDEVTSSREMRAFASAFQIFVRHDLPVYLLMTGLFENIEELQNEKTLTFLYRAPKIALSPLNIGAIARNYRKTFDIDEGTALHMAQLTRGFSYAFQLLGYLVWENGGTLSGVMDNYRQYLDDYVYEKIWSECSAGDRRIAYAIAKSGTGKVQEIRAVLGIDNNQFNPYRKRLLRKGLIDGTERGYVRFLLPLFEDFVLENYYTP